jgi:hypothetical protein
MFSPFRRKPKTHSQDALFGDLPISQWPSETSPPPGEPWSSFAEARSRLEAGQSTQAIQILQRILAMPDLESRHYLQAWHFLRETGIRPEADVAKNVYGVIVEFDLGKGLDTIAAYADGRARYFNFSGAAVIWEAPDDSLRPLIEDVLRAGKVVADRIGPWEGNRPPVPPKGHARISMLTPSGLHFGQAPVEVLSRDPLGGPVISAATALMQALIGKVNEAKSSQNPRAT